MQEKREDRGGDTYSYPWDMLCKAKSVFRKVRKYHFSWLSSTRFLHWFWGIKKLWLLSKSPEKVWAVSSYLVTNRLADGVKSGTFSWRLIRETWRQVLPTVQLLYVVFAPGILLRQCYKAWRIIWFHVFFFVLFTVGDLIQSLLLFQRYESVVGHTKVLTYRNNQWWTVSIQWPCESIKYSSCQELGGKYQCFYVDLLLTNLGIFHTYPPPQKKKINKLNKINKQKKALLIIFGLNSRWISSCNIW